MYSEEGLLLQGPNSTQYENATNIAKSRVVPNRSVDVMHYFDENGAAVREDQAAPFYLPTWQTSPVLKTGLVNENLLRRESLESGLLDMATSGYAFFTKFFALTPGDTHSEIKETALIATLRSYVENEVRTHSGSPISNLVLPIFDSLNQTIRKPVAVLSATIHWRGYFRNILPADVNGIDVVLRSTCSEFFTFRIDGPKVSAVGYGDLHDPTMDDKWTRTGNWSSTALNDGTDAGIRFHPDGCQYSVSVTPSQVFYDTHHTVMPVINTCVIIAVFLFSILMFFLYDRLVERRQGVVLAKATKSAAIITSLFPKDVANRMMDDSVGFTIGNKSRVKGFLDGGADHQNNDAPIADLFPECTVFFGDIAGFTAWSSTRDPAQVFVLLQAIYQTFDQLASKRHVWKVETIGDCYMAVTGLPEPQEDHAPRVRITNRILFANVYRIRLSNALFVCSIFRWPVSQMPVCIK